MGPSFPGSAVVQRVNLAMTLGKRCSKRRWHGTRLLSGSAARCGAASRRVFREASWEAWRTEAKEHSRERKKTNRSRRSANEDMEDEVMNLISQVHLELTIQLESRSRGMEAAAQCTLFPLRYSAILTEVPSAGRFYNDLLTDKGRPAHLVLHCDAEGFSAIRTSATTSSRSGKGGEDAETIVEKKKQPQEMLAWVQACRYLPMFARLGEEPRSRTIFATDGPTLWKKQEGEEDQRFPHLALKEVMATTQGDSSRNRRMHTQELIMARRCTLRGTRSSGQGSAWNLGKTAARCASEGRERKGNGVVPMTPVGAESQRLLKRWRDRRQCVSEPPMSRNERESELVASLVRVAQ